MATKKTAAPKKVVKIAGKKKVVKNATKFRRKNADGTSSRKGPKTVVVWTDSKYIVDLLTQGFSRPNVIKIIDRAVDHFDQKALKSFMKLVLAKADEKTRASILRKYLLATKVTMSAEDKKALTIGRKMLKMAK